MARDRTPRAKVGVISDTHGLVRPEALDALRGSDLVVHAGDLGDAAVLDALGAVARVEAIRGNNDRGEWARGLRDTRSIEIAGARIYLVHAIQDLDVDPIEQRIDAVIAGHSHKPSIETREGVLYVNPGSAGPRRFKLPVSVARIEIRGRRVTAEIVTLDV